MRAGHNRRERARRKRLRALNVAYSREERERRGCEVTGQRLPWWELEWHHIGDKYRDVSVLTYRSHKRFCEELAQCISVWKEVHRALHSA